ncbi:hypothetical protein [Rhizobium tubonense]|uniref:Uncharacterized protein n=1 Tax=Rhizobium tubonense TaxID=484088 RepID=A0A2W4C9L5_9HYPH|nr:hypothetical protein [Rhizobium tubonense]PZM10027.1 hypothetical protein CPY51_23975 [Rhizobium tubonense]
MLRAKRDALGGAACKAIPSLGEIEGRVMILELVALTSLSRLLHDHERHGRLELIKAMRHAIDRKCHDARLCGQDTRSAEEYAEELLASAQEQADQQATLRKHC